MVLLGTAGGPVWSDPERYGPASALVHEDRVYLVDLGQGAESRMVAAGLGAGDGHGSTLSQLRAVFLTHLHSDPVGEWPALYASGPMNIVGRKMPPVAVFGPGDRGSLPRVFP